MKSYLAILAINSAICTAICGTGSLNEPMSTALMAIFSSPFTSLLKDTQKLSLTFRFTSNQQHNDVAYNTYCCEFLRQYLLIPFLK